MNLNKIRIIILVICVILHLMMWFRCGKTPTDTPPIQYGSAKIVAQIDSISVDSAEVILDNISLGLKSLPFLMTDIIAGTHQFSLKKEDPFSPIDYSSVPKLAAVPANDTAEVVIALTKLAPNFTLYNLDNEEITLEHYRGKVVLLIFYSYT